MKKHWTEILVDWKNKLMWDKMKERENNFPYPSIKTYSNCCGEENRMVGDCDYQDLGICPSCKEHCEYLTEEEMENDNG